MFLDGLDNLVFVSNDPIGIGGNIYTQGVKASFSQYVEAVSTPYLYTLNNPVNFVDPSGLAWFREHDHDYKAGRAKTIVPEGPYGRGRYIDDYVPAGHTFASLHDTFVGIATSEGVPDWLVNIPSMPFLYIGAVGKEALNSAASPFSIDFFEHKKDHDGGTNTNCP